MRNRALLIPLIAALSIGCGEDQEAKTPKPDIASGRSLAQAECAGCHGLDGKGVAPGIPNLAAQFTDYLHDSLIAYKEGKRTHAALRDLTSHMSEKQLTDVVAFYASLPPVRSEKAERQITLSPYEKGKALSASCANCHGEDGNAKQTGVPNLAGQQPLYFVSALQAYLHGTREIASMEQSLRGLNRVNMENLAVYYASQIPVRTVTQTVGDPAAGEPLTAGCGGCHGAHGVSHDASTPTLAGQDEQYLVSAIKSYRDQTRHHEVMLSGNTDEEIQNIAAYYAVQESKAAESGATTVKELSDKCDRCHGAGVDNPAMAIPKIQGQDRDYLIKALRAYRDGKRGSSLMHNMSLPYSEAVIESVASLYANQPAR